MGYLLVAPDVLDTKGIKYYERIPDGRGIVDFSMIRVIGSVERVQIVSSKRELDKIILEQKESGMYDTPTILPEMGGDLVAEEGQSEDVEDAVIVEGNNNTTEMEVTNGE